LRNGVDKEEIRRSNAETRAKRLEKSPTETGNGAHSDARSGSENSLASNDKENAFAGVTEIFFAVLSESTKVSKTAGGTEDRTWYVVAAFSEPWRFKSWAMDFFGTA
jgi:hypothetical protein